jgi:cytoskeletal protein CcmA (bactofilin family)
MAREIKLAVEKTTFAGIVEAIGDTEWMVGGQIVQIDADTEIEGDIQVSDRVKVKAVVPDDGSLLARKIELDPASVKLIGPVDAMGETEWTIGGQVVRVDGSTEVESDIQIGDRVEVKANALSDGSFLARSIKLSEAKHDLGKVRFTGVVETMEGDTWTIAGQAVHVSGDTRLSGDIQVGDRVEVKAVAQRDGSLHAESIRLDDHGQDDARAREPNAGKSDEDKPDGREKDKGGKKKDK